jgi:hypothetical protein
MNDMLVSPHLIQKPVHQVSMLEAIFTCPLFNLQFVYLVLQLLHPVVEDTELLVHPLPLLNLHLE